MFEIYLSCSLITATSWFLELNFDFAYVNLLNPHRPLPEKKQTYRSVESINVAYFILNSVDMTPGRMRNIFAGYRIRNRIKTTRTERPVCSNCVTNFWFDLNYCHSSFSCCLIWFYWIFFQAESEDRSEYFWYFLRVCIF